jgi:hypothetical protein
MGFVRLIEGSGQNDEEKKEERLHVLVWLLLERSSLAARGLKRFLTDLGNCNL